MLPVDKITQTIHPLIHTVFFSFVYVDGDIIMLPSKEVNGIDISKFRDRVMVHNKLQNVTGFIWFNTSTILLGRYRVLLCYFSLICTTNSTCTFQ